MKTEITELLGIEYPVIQGGMAWVAECHLFPAESSVHLFPADAAFFTVCKRFDFSFQ